MKQSAKRFCNRRHSVKWTVLGSVLGGATSLTQFIPQSWPTWAGIGLTVLAFALAGVSSVIAPESN